MADDFINLTASTSTIIALIAIEQYTNPYFLHHSDNTSLVLVSDPLTNENYTSWSRSMLIALTVKNKVGFVDGSIVRPTGDLLHSWIICNNVVISWILNSLSKEISASILFSDSAREIWLDLKERFEKQNRPRIFQLRRDLSNLVQDQLSVSAYFTLLKTLWTELNSYSPSCTFGRCSCGGVKEIIAFQQQEHVMCFLMGLNESFSQLRVQLLLMEPEPTINRVFSLVSQEAQQRAILTSTSPQTLPTALMARSSSSSGFSKSVSNSSSYSRQAFLHTLRYNLLYVSALTADSSVSVLFADNCCILQDKSSSKMIGKAESWHGLYLLSVELYAALTIVVCNSAYHTWHNRLGHPSPKHLFALKNVLHIDSVSKHDSDFPCEIFPLAKQKRLRFESHNNISVYSFDLIHCDVWGPFSSLSHASCNATDLFSDIVLPRAAAYSGISVYEPTVSNSIGMTDPLMPPSFDVDSIGSPIVVGSDSSGVNILHTDGVVDVVDTPFVAHDGATSDFVHDVSSDNVDTLISVRASVVAPRRSSRPTRKPSYLQDYHCGLIKSNVSPVSSVQYLLHKHLVYDWLCSNYRGFVLNVSATYEPQFYHQAVSFSHWRDAMRDELQAMESNYTWSVVPLTSGQHSIGCKWVYKIKYKSDGTIDRYKARLVAKGYT
ncbi:uncharacterized protein LOC111020399 [Momordica charantia]|uniref:Uncharacterized protein LOC111020399 n=1 Tax=Momordica charantia TaxID=3673 RepID=A0A6J1DIP8_MOMCH|nr:uncharacterized protein LOC111020399 [Momordica charantia]